LLKKLILKIKKTPKTPGIYIFKNQKGKALYIGKAINLRSRLKSYLGSQSGKTAAFLKKSKKLKWIKVSSDLEAIILEMKLIKNLKPAYNVRWRDDKRPLYVLFTNDALPRVKTVRLSQKVDGKLYGPFPSPYKLRKILKTLRRIFPFCTCSPRRKKPCLYTHLGLCPLESALGVKNPPPLEQRAYFKNIKNLQKVLDGKIGKVLKILQKEMKTHAQNQEFEKAQEIKNKIEQLKLFSEKPHIDQYLESKSLKPQLIRVQLKSLQKLLARSVLASIQNAPCRLGRIEGYDIANLGKTLAVGSMVVFEKGQPTNNLYRRFKIRKVKGINDPKMLAEVLSRRLNHPEWPFPDLILVDGGKTQVSACLKVLKKLSFSIPVIGLAKKKEKVVLPHIKVEPCRKKSSKVRPRRTPERSLREVTLALDHPGLTLLRQIRDEAHRFAHAYHQLLRRHSLTKSPKY